MQVCSERSYRTTNLRQLSIQANDPSTFQWDLFNEVFVSISPWGHRTLRGVASSGVILTYENDRHGAGNRLELAFLKSTTPKLVRGGVLAFVIPQRILRLAEVARYLASQYERLTVLRFPDGEYELFKQVLLLAIRREKYNFLTNEEIEVLQRLAESDLLPLGFDYHKL